MFTPKKVLSLGFILVLAISLPIINTAPSPYLVELDSLPNIYLAPGETIKLNIQEYFSGFNITFDPDIVSSKIQFLSSVNPTDYEISKAFETNTEIIVALYKDPDYLSWVIYDKKKSSFGNIENMRFGIQGLNSCDDIEFLNSDTIIAHCYTTTGSSFYFINIQTKAVHQTPNPLLSPLGGSKHLIRAKGYMDSQIILYATGTNQTNWAYMLYSFDDQFRITKNETYDFGTYVDDLPKDFVLVSLAVKDSRTLILQGKSQIAIVPDQDRSIIKSIADWNNKLVSMSEVLAISSFGLSSFIVAAENAIYECIINQNHELVSINTYTPSYGKQISSISQSEDFIYAVAKDSTSGYYLHIFQRGDSTPETTFYVKMMGKDARVLPISSNNFVLADLSVKLVKVQEPEIILSNKNHSHGQETAHITVSSLKKTISRNITINYLTQDDATIYTQNDDLTLSIHANQSITINLKDLFIGPDLTFDMEMDEAYDNFAINYLDYPVHLERVPQNYSFIKMENVEGDIRVYAQASNNKTHLKMINCHVDYSKKSIECSLNTTSFEFGKVIDMYLNHPVYIYMVVQEGDSFSLYALNKANLTDNSLIIGNCLQVYHSFDNLLEQNTYCVRGSYIIVSVPGRPQYVWKPPTTRFNRIQTHHNYPGVVFVSNSTNLMVFSTNMFKEPILLSNLYLEDSFDFVVTNNNLVIFFIEKSTINEYDLSDLTKISYKKTYMLFDYKLEYSKDALTYSPLTDFIYFLAYNSSDPTEKSILVFKPNSPANSNLQYDLYVGYVETADIKINLGYFDRFTDLLFTYVQGELSQTSYQVFPYAFINVNEHFPMNLTQLYKTYHFNITAGNQKAKDAVLPGELTLINTQRQITPKNKTNLTLELAFDGVSSLEFKGEDLFNGPVFYFDLAKEYEKDPIELNLRVDYQKGALLMEVDAADYNEHLVAVSSLGQIFTYDAKLFPGEIKQQKVFNLSCNSTEIAVDTQTVIARCVEGYHQNYFEYINLSTNKICRINTGSALDEAEFKTKGDLLVVLVPNVFDTLQIYRLGGSECASLKAEVSKGSLGLKPYELAYSFDLYTNSQGDNLIFVTTAGSGFKIVRHRWNYEPEVYAPNNLEGLLKPDHLDSRRQPVIFNGIKIVEILEDKEGNIINFDILLSSANGFTYLFHCLTDLSGVFQDCFVRKGFIQYHEYTYKPILLANKRYFALLGDHKNFMRTTVFLYDLRSQSPLPDHREKYPLYDAFEALPGISMSDDPILLFDKGQYSILLQYEPFAAAFDYYIIKDSFSISSNASHINTKSVKVIASNDRFDANTSIAVYNYRAIFHGYGTAQIIVIVFLSLLGLFAVLVILNRYLHRAKRDLKDEMPYAESGYAKFTEQ